VSWGSGFPPDLTSIVAITAGLALRDNGTVVAWGGNNYSETDVPAGLTNVVAIAAQYYRGLALAADGRIVTWPGSDTVAVGLSNVVRIAAGAYHNLALKSDGSIVVWGDNQFGQTNMVTDIHDAVGIAAGWWHNLVLMANGTVVGFGYNADGQATIPTGLSNVVAISCGNFHSLALKADGTVVVWGYGDVYAPYDSEYGQAILPQGLSNVTSIAGADYFSLALIGDGPRVQEALLVDPSSNGNIFRLSLLTEIGRVYRLEYKDALQDTQWTALPLVAGNGRQRCFEDATTHGAHRFYRVTRW
jgi:alpha-tubulin suppressor-like RCC1 family protein